MTDPRKSHITIVADRSGSMASIRSDAEGGINSFLKDQKKIDGDCTLYFTEFDTWIDTVHDGDLTKMGKYTLSPRGGTALFDAIGQAINKTGDVLRALREKDRPANVFFVISTDGEENSSREFKLAQVVSMIKEQEDKWNWNFVFLAAGTDAFAQAGQFVGTNMYLNNTVRGRSDQYGSTYSVATASIGQTRVASMAGGAAAAFNITDNDITDEEDEKPRQKANLSGT